MKLRRITTITSLIAALIVSVWAIRELNGPLNPWRRYGVTAEWFHYGNTGLYGARYTAHYAGRAITAEACPGATYDFHLSSSDTDGDGIPELLMTNARCRMVLAFRPSYNDQPPEFKTLEDNWPP
jgi:hypothetical protein